ncbi:MAG: hypothetical protein MJ175_04530 [Clostridia bacterium]|nr:hypothetical protein [Clostridia bacterium]
MQHTDDLLCALPPYRTAGSVSPALYDAGCGICDERSLDDPDRVPHFSDGELITEPEFLARLTKLDEEAISFHYQYSPAGSISVRIENNERLADITFQSGKVSIRFPDDYRPGTQPHSFVRTIRNTTQEEFSDYLSCLAAEGLVLLRDRSADGSRFAEFSHDGMLLLCSYSDRTHIARLILDPVSLPLREIDDRDTAPGQTEVWQYGLHHAKNRGGFTMDCGMCYLAALPDGSLFLVDGGEYEQATEAATEGLFALMKRLSRSDGKIRLTWFCTHAHDDHMDMFARLIRLHHDEIALERVLFNFPAKDKYDFAPNLYMTYNRILSYYPAVRYRKLHTGDTFTLGGCPMEVLQTHEDGTKENGDECIGWFNDTSTVLRLKLDPEDETGNSDFLILGDIDGSAEQILLANHSPEALHAGMVQTAHHLFNKLDHLYDVIRADIALVPQTARCRTNHDSPKYAVVARTVPEENFYFSDSGSDAFRPEGGKIVHTAHEPRIGGVYDGALL